MIDAGKQLRDLLLSKADLTALTGARIYAETDFPAKGYTPANGPAVTFRIRGGGQETQQNALLSLSVQFKCYGADEVKANQCYRALHDVLDQARSGTVCWAEMETPGQTLREPETGWVFVLTFYRVVMNNA